VLAVHALEVGVFSALPVFALELVMFTDGDRAALG